MSHEQDKYKYSKRRFQEEVAVKKQVKIAKEHGYTIHDKAIQEPHRYAKHRAMDCGNPECFMCGNPRKTHKDKLTAQEKKLFQDLDQVRDFHSNGLPVNEHE